MILNATKINITDFSFSIFPPKDRLQEWRHLANILKTKYNNFAQIKIDKPFKLRSTGYKSQSNHFHGHCQQIAENSGHTMTEVKNAIKERCTSWPTELICGVRVKISESKISSAVSAEAIELTHVEAAEQGIRLREDD